MVLLGGPPNSNLVSNIEIGNSKIKVCILDEDVSVLSHALCLRIDRGNNSAGLLQEFLEHHLGILRALLAAATKRMFLRLRSFAKVMLDCQL